MRHRGRTPTLPALALLLTSGCAATGTLSAPVHTLASGGWGTAAEGIVLRPMQDLSRWWEQLGDATLTDLIDRTLNGSPDVRTAQARLRQARAAQNVTQAGLLPSVSASASATDRNDGAGGFSAGFDASWEPDIFGGTRRAVDASMADLRATSADLHATQVSLAAEVARNYVELRTLQTRVEIAGRNEASQAETVELTEFRAVAGLVGSIDVERARANLEQTRAQIPSLQSGVSQTMHRLAVLAGLEPSALSAQLSPSATLPAVPPQVAVGIPAETLRQRPDVQAAEQRIVAETARLAEAHARRYPQFTLSGSIGIDIVNGAFSGGTSLVAAAARSVLQTVWDGGQVRQQIAIQSAVQEQAVASYDATVLTALEDVENALVSFERARQRLASLNAAATGANNAAILARTEYSAGLTDFLTVLDTERTVLSVADSIASTQGERLTALVQLYKALGGGWSPRAADASITGNTTS